MAEAEAATRVQTLGEEIASSVSHGVGAVLAIAALVTLAILGAMTGEVDRIVSLVVYGTTLVLLYTSSTLYHAFPWPRVKHLFRIFDHSAIYLLIAGTYTPVAVVTFGGGIGYTMLVAVWTLAIIGIVFKSLWLGKFQIFSVLLYIAMGWMGIFAAQPALELLTLHGVGWFAAGGVAYTAGVAFYSWTNLKYHHLLWHLFVLLGSALHFVAIVSFVA